MAREIEVPSECRIDFLLARVSKDAKSEELLKFISVDGDDCRDIIKEIEENNFILLPPMKPLLNVGEERPSPWPDEEAGSENCYIAARIELGGSPIYIGNWGGKDMKEFCMRKFREVSQKQKLPKITDDYEPGGR